MTEYYINIFELLQTFLLIFKTFLTNLHKFSKSSILLSQIAYVIFFQLFATNYPLYHFFLNRFFWSSQIIRRFFFKFQYPVCNLDCRTYFHSVILEIGLTDNVIRCFILLLKAFLLTNLYGNMILHASSRSWSLI